MHNRHPFPAIGISSRFCNSESDFGSFRSCSVVAYCDWQISLSKKICFFFSLLSLVCFSDAIFTISTSNGRWWLLLLNCLIKYYADGCGLSGVVVTLLNLFHLKCEQNYWSYFLDISRLQYSCVPCFSDTNWTVRTWYVFSSFEKCWLIPRPVAKSFFDKKAFGSSGLRAPVTWNLFRDQLTTIPTFYNHRLISE